ncbi:MAG: lactate utilization protein [Ferruginibacter sp.]
MAASSAKENILKKIRQALINPVPLPFPQSDGEHEVYINNNEDATVVFAEEFTKLQGKFAYCLNEENLAQQVQQLLHERNFTNVWCKDSALQALLSMHFTPYENLPDCDVAITGCEYLVARTGSMVLSAQAEEGRTGSVYAPIHICIAYTSQLVFDLKDALIKLKEKYNNKIPSVVSFASGPSRTADIEKTLVTGVHGPKEVYCFLVEG